MSDYRNHAWRHHPTKGTDPIAGTTDFFSSPIMIPLLNYAGDQLDTSAFQYVKVDSTVRYGAYLTNGFNAAGAARTTLSTDAFSFMASLGPTGSVWGLVGSWREHPAGGSFKLRIATVESPNPNRGVGADYQPGSLIEENLVTYHDVNAIEIDTYAAAAADISINAFLEYFVIGGFPGDSFTGATTTDGYTGYPIIDGGPGMYRTELYVSGKNASSTGYQIDMTALAWIRVDDVNFV